MWSPSRCAETGRPGGRFDPVVGFDSHLAQIDARLDEAGVTQPIVIGGISYGGLAALRYAAMRPARVRALVLASTPAPQLATRAVGSALGAAGPASTLPHSH